MKRNPNSLDIPSLIITCSKIISLPEEIMVKVIEKMTEVINKSKETPVIIRHRTTKAELIKTFINDKQPLFDEDFFHSIIQKIPSFYINEFLSTWCDKNGQLSNYALIQTIIKKGSSNYCCSILYPFLPRAYNIR